MATMLCKALSVMEAVESARPISLPLYGPFLLLLPPVGAPTSAFLSLAQLIGGPGSIEFFSYGGASHVSIEPPSLLSSPPFGRPSGRVRVQ